MKLVDIHSSILFHRDKFAKNVIFTSYLDYIHKYKNVKDIKEIVLDSISDSTCRMAITRTYIAERLHDRKYTSILAIDSSIKIKTVQDVFNSIVGFLMVKTRTNCIPNKKTSVLTIICASKPSPTRKIKGIFSMLMTQYLIWSKINRYDFGILEIASSGIKKGVYGFNAIKDTSAKRLWNLYRNHGFIEYPILANKGCFTKQYRYVTMAISLKNTLYFDIVFSLLDPKHKIPQKRIPILESKHKTVF